MLFSHFRARQALKRMLSRFNDCCCNQNFAQNNCKQTRSETVSTANYPWVFTPNWNYKSPEPVISKLYWTMACCSPKPKVPEGISCGLDLYQPKNWHPLRSINKFYTKCFFCDSFTVNYSNSRACSRICSRTWLSKTIFEILLSDQIFSGLRINRIVKSEQHRTEYKGYPAVCNCPKLRHVYPCLFFSLYPCH